MADGRLKSQWAQTSNVLAMIFNTNVAKESDRLESHDFNPFIEKPPPPKVGVEFVKDMFIKKKD